MDERERERKKKKEKKKKKGKKETEKEELRHNVDINKGSSITIPLLKRT